MSVRPVAKAPAATSNDIATRQGAVVSFKCESHTVRFFVDNPEDSIQAHHEAGRFFEWDELEALRRHVERGVSVLDVGASGGNHTVFFERILGASKVVPIEASPSAIERLRLNVALNDLTRTDLGHLGIALGARPAQGAAFVLGAANPHHPMILADPLGDSRSCPEIVPWGDTSSARFASRPNGARSTFLQGLSGTIRRNWPVLFVNVWDRTRRDVEALLRTWGYGIADEPRRGDAAVNLVFKHGVS